MPFLLDMNAQDDQIKNGKHRFTDRSWPSV